MSGTATPSEVFHRNLVDAVSNVEGMHSIYGKINNALILNGVQTPMKMSNMYIRIVVITQIQQPHTT